MRLTSHGTGGARRRLRKHSDRHRALTWRGTLGTDLVFELHADDGRTYTLRLDAADVAEVARGARARKREGERGEGVMPDEAIKGRVALFGECADYEGGWKDGKPHGHGVMTFPDGARIAGEWLGGAPVTAERPA